ncbi:MAG: formimidoylglutamase [Chitinophagales bacterium]|nr:formimidoylglutamase [Chitinophagales bacterium]
MLEELVQPLSSELKLFYTGLPANRWGAQVTFYEGLGLDLECHDLAIIGVGEERGTEGNAGCGRAAELLRDELYNLVRNEAPLRIIDLGNVKLGEKMMDTYYALATVLEELMMNKVTPIVIGGSHDLTLAQYMAYEKLKKQVNLVVVDERIDLQDVDAVITDENFLGRLLTYEPLMLHHYTHIGYQSYFTDSKSIATLEKLNFDCIRLGDMRKNMEEAEPLVRDADLVSFDISAIKMGDAPGHRLASPNGFYGEEACQITRYAGMSDRVSSLGLYGFNPTFDHQRQTAQLLAQMVWYFVEGYYNRKGDNPVEDHREYLKYIVDFKEGEYELVFWKSKKSDRWWLEVPAPPGKKHKPKLVSCSYADYQTAVKEELPDRWIRAYERQ